MENISDRQSSGNNIHGIRLPRAPTHDLFSTPARPLHQASSSVCIDGTIQTCHPVQNGCAVSTSQNVPTNSTNSIIPTIPTSPMIRNIVTGQTAPTAHHTMPFSRRSPTTRTTATVYTTSTNGAMRTSRSVIARPTNSTGSNLPIGHTPPTNCTLPSGSTIVTNRIVPTEHAPSTSRTTPTIHTLPTGCTTHTSSAVHTYPAVYAGPAASTGLAVSVSRTGPTGRTTPYSFVPRGPAVGTRSAISTSSAVPPSRTLSTDPTNLTNRTINNNSAVCPCTCSPTYLNLLKFQSRHRSKCIIDGNYLEPLSTREHIVYLPWDPRYEEYVIAAGLYGVHKIGHIPTDHALISALVERWHQETHTFHFPVGEMTITLQDVAVLLGLRVDGDAICLQTNRNWHQVVASLLGRVDAKTFRKKSRVAINISWLLRHFSVCPDDADDITVRRFARAYCFVLVGSVLFTDHSGDSISAIYLPLFANFERAGRYSWASGVLAYLYKELCLATNPKRMQFGGSVMLLQLWSWERLPMGRPTARRNVERPQLGGEDLTRRPPLGYGWSFDRKFVDHVTCRVMESYRREIDGLVDDKVKWLPYEDRMHLLPANCRAEDRMLWRTTAPLIHFWIVEMYNPGRVARQFNRYQRFPPHLRDTNEDLHKLKNGRGKNWPRVHVKYLDKWHIRQHLRLRDQRPYDHSSHEEYMGLLSRASILYLSSPGGVPNTNSSAKRVTQIATSIVEKFRDVANEDSRAFARQLLHHCKSAVQAMLEPTGDGNIFAALDGEPPRRRGVTPVLDGDAGPSNRAPTKRARYSASTSC